MVQDRGEAGSDKQRKKNRDETEGSHSLVPPEHDVRIALRTGMRVGEQNVVANII